MAEIVLGIGASHTTLMNTQWAKVDHLERAHRFRDALGAAHERLVQARPDAVVIIGSNHFRGFWLDLMPAFTIGVGDVLSSGEHGMPTGALPCDAPLASELCSHIIGHGFDLAFSTNLTVDHGISHAVQWVMRDLALPIVPIVINCFAPPLPTLKRTRQFGGALRAALLSASATQRVAVIATGGLSHRLPFPDWRAPQSEDEEFLADSFRHGRGRWQAYEDRRRKIVINAPSRLNERFDAAMLDVVAHGRVSEIADRLPDDLLVRVAGNGANEIRAWQVMAAAMSHQPGQVLSYSPMPEWLTGMAVAVIDPEAAPAAARDEPCWQALIEAMT